MDDRSKLLYQNANTLRIHQDNLRWTIGGSYLVFMAGVLYAKNKMDCSIQPWVYPGLFVIGNCFLITLSIESWYYNVYSRYVKACERLGNSESAIPLEDFRRNIASTVTPFHYSFFFILAIFAISNACWLVLSLGSLSGVPRCCFWVGYLAASGVACRYWNSLPFLFLDELKVIFSPKADRL